MTLKTPKPTSSPAPAEVFLPDDNDFPYGWRLVSETLPDGRIAYRRVPLTQADFLDPQEGDQMPQNSLHAQLTIDLFTMFDNRYHDHPDILVLSDVKMRWGIPNLPGPSPDVAVIPNIKDKMAYRSSFYVFQEGTRPCLVIEIVSPEYPGDKTDKVEIYRQAGVTEYIILDPHSKDETASWELIGYRLIGEEYQSIQPDSAGRLLSQTTGVHIGLGVQQRSLVLTDAVTDAPLMTASAAKALADAEAKGRLAAETRAEAETEARLAAEARAEAEIEARLAVEARLRELEARYGLGEADDEHD